MTFEYLIGWAEGMIGGITLCIMVPLLIATWKMYKAEKNKKE